jgi:hypothetical protein
MLAIWDGTDNFKCKMIHILLGGVTMKQSNLIRFAILACQTMNGPTIPTVKAQPIVCVFRAYAQSSTAGTLALTARLVASLCIDWS